jgi:hypothetical protein
MRTNDITLTSFDLLDVAKNKTLTRPHDDFDAILNVGPSTMAVDSDKDILYLKFGKFYSASIKDILAAVASSPPATKADPDTFSP